MSGSVSMIDGHIDEPYLRAESVVCKAIGEGIATSCMICEDIIAIPWPHDQHKICDKCKAAVMKMRSSMESEG